MTDEIKKKGLFKLFGAKKEKKTLVVVTLSLKKYLQKIMKETIRGNQLKMKREMKRTLLAVNRTEFLQLA